MKPGCYLLGLHERRAQMRADLAGRARCRASRRTCGVSGWAGPLTDSRPASSASSSTSTGTSPAPPSAPAPPFKSTAYRRFRSLLGAGIIPWYGFQLRVARAELSPTGVLEQEWDVEYPVKVSVPYALPECAQRDVTAGSVRGEGSPGGASPLCRRQLHCPGHILPSPAPSVT